MISSVAKSNKGKKAGRKEGSKSISINSEKLAKFCQLYSLNTPKKEIEKELKIAQAQYYRYIDAAEEIVDDFLLGMVDHGLVLQFRNKLVKVAARAEKVNAIADKLLDDYDNLDESGKSECDRMVRNANMTDKLHNELLDDTKIVNQTVKTLNKVIVKSSQKKE